MTDMGQGNLGSWSNDDLQKTFREASEAGADADLPDEVRFLSGVAKLVKKQLVQASQEGGLKEPAIFLLAPKISSAHSNLPLKRVPMLDNGKTAVNGRLWFVSPVVVVGHYVAFPDRGDDENFRYITDDLNLGDVPTIILDPRQDPIEFRFYPNGLSDANSCTLLTVPDPDVSLEKVLDEVSQIYERDLITPDAQGVGGKLWKTPDDYIPMSEAEVRIQSYLKTGLGAKFSTCTIRTEQSSKSGRLDILVEEIDPRNRGIVKVHVLLELKVLRSYWSSGTAVSEKTTLDWIEDGVIQAAFYRDDRYAIAAALCCFDMRETNMGVSCFDHVLELANTHVITLWVRFCYSSAKRYRKDQQKT